MVEIGTGLAFGLAWLRYPNTIWSLLFAGYSAILILILAIDLEYHRILNKLTYPAILFALLAAPLMPGHLWWEFLIGGALGFGSLFLLAVFFPAGMGMGDVKLGAFIGLVVGYPEILLVLFLSFVFGGFISGIMVLTRRIGRRDPIAFAPYLGFAAITTILYGEQILTWWAGGI
jgi:prepilin signal peptidase PulO-like enzyme (type II secretory pathway)